MSKKSVIERNKKRIKMVAKYAKRRAELKAIIKNQATSDEEFFKAKKELAEMPRDSSRIRIRNRCQITGRPRAYLRKYGVSRLTFRELATSGKAPGVTKSSW